MKKLFCTVLAIIMLVVPFTLSTAAQTVNYDDLVAPCYYYFSNLYTDIKAGSLGFVNCTSTVTTYETDKTVVLTCVLQRKDSSSDWSDYKSKSETYSGMGSYSIDKSWYAPSGYSYRTLARVEIKNSAGTVIETASYASTVLSK